MDRWRVRLVGGSSAAAMLLLIVAPFVLVGAISTSRPGPRAASDVLADAEGTLARVVEVLTREVTEDNREAAYRLVFESTPRVELACRRDRVQLVGIGAAGAPRRGWDGTMWEDDISSPPVTNLYVGSDAELRDRVCALARDRLAPLGGGIP